ncbi:YjgN family protein [Trinickia caryophylli]|uniref:Uncharacterized membrane protein YjgN, DUF898 family n=1 Tax=Trinickia caryophylli TaxID=28094 RepID=A0A1X7EHC0_TRICW|nr:YjgN family protein [Trinickia caryophylli]PMS11035.1 DUF898 domain-containing protein [Trinickia caryophylli]TRX14492.1 DUF898 domain-containing protein [Trinickia caryophylli]WQE14331.1 YjgN family protein [Trinickia caryophylli]SMF33881.1 Uncharacterized membrane protein YjgN, DUF898 family [Trinickia caryophylli]GLU32286.1 membrane protein [Trinickia caryophylli]
METTTNVKTLLVYDGKTRELYGIFLKNLLLSLVTVGIYRFWARTNMRRYVWSHMRFQGERFEYTGTGGELFKGFLIAFATLIGAIVVAMVLSVALTRISGNKVLGALPIIALYLAIAVLAAGAYFSAQRYRLSRTLWRGIRGGMSGSAFGYGARVLLYGLLCLVTLYQLWPWVTVRLAERRINASSFGSEPFSFKGKAGRLYGVFVLTFLGIVLLIAGMVALFLRPILVAIATARMSGGQDPAVVQHMLEMFALYAVLIVGIWLISCSYLAHVVRHIVGNTTLGTHLRFGSGVTAKGLLGLMLGNLAIVAVTLGFGYPIALQRSLRYTAATLTVQGEIDPATILQNAGRAPRSGEGMLDLLDHGGAVL